MVDNNFEKKQKSKMNSSNKNAIVIMILFFLVITAFMILTESDSLDDIFSLKKSKAQTPGDLPTENVVSSEESTDKTDTEATEKTTEVTTEKTEEPTSEVTTTATDTAESTENTTEDVVDTVLPPVSEIKGQDWYNAQLFQPAQPVDGKYFDNTVLIGDSRTESLALFSGYDNINSFAYKGLNVGAIKSDRVIKISGVEYTVEEAVSATYYDNYYISFGINELGWQYISVFTEDISELIDMIYTRNPKAMVYVASVVPVSKAVSDQDDVFNKENVDRFNLELLKMVQDRGDVIYIDYAAAVRDDEGYLPEEGSVDGKHCTSDYNKRIMQYILTHIYERVR